MAATRARATTPPGAARPAIMDHTTRLGGTDGGYACPLSIYDKHMRHAYALSKPDVLIRYAYPMYRSDMQLRYAYRTADPLCKSDTQTQKTLVHVFVQTLAKC